MRRALALGVAAVLFGAIGAACSTNALVAKGGACFQSLDCQDGLVCIYTNDAGSCSDDLTGIVKLPAESGSDAAVPDAVADAPLLDQNVPDNNVTDTGTQDTGTQDTGAQDTGTDTGAPDAGNG